MIGIDTVCVATSSAAGGGNNSFTIIPNGWFYRLTGNNFTTWAELR